jgi:hypothetical protein
MEARPTSPCCQQLLLVPFHDVTAGHWHPHLQAHILQYAEETSRRVGPEATIAPHGAKQETSVYTLLPGAYGSLINTQQHRVQWKNSMMKEQAGISSTNAGQ